MDQEVRIKTAELCAKLLADKLSGPKVRTCCTVAEATKQDVPSVLSSALVK